MQVGDLLRLHNGEDVPADMVLLASSDPEVRAAGGTGLQGDTAGYTDHSTAPTKSAAPIHQLVHCITFAPTY